MTTESPHDHDRKRGPLVGCLVVAIIVLPILYVLSFGPACWLGNNGFLGEEAKILYAPLVLVAEWCPPLKGELQWYIDLWR